MKYQLDPLLLYRTPHGRFELYDREGGERVLADTRLNCLLQTAHLMGLATHYVDLATWNISPEHRFDNVPAALVYPVFRISDRQLTKRKPPVYLFECWREARRRREAAAEAADNPPSKRYGWTAAFFDALEHHRRIAKAAAAVRICPETVYARARRDEAFRARVDAVRNAGPRPLLPKTIAKRERFLEAYALHLTLRGAERDAGVSPITHRKWVENDPDFARRFREVQHHVAERLKAYDDEDHAHRTEAAHKALRAAAAKHTLPRPAWVDPHAPAPPAQPAYTYGAGPHWRPRPETREKMQRFLDAYALVGVAAAAEHAVGVSKSHRRYWMNNDPVFAWHFHEIRRGFAAAAAAGARGPGAHEASVAQRPAPAPTPVHTSRPETPHLWRS